jgi:hypothetical protein
LLVELVHVLGHGFPIEVHGAQHFHGDGFDIGQKLGRSFLFPGPYGRHGEGTVANQHGGDTMVGRKGAQRIPRHLGIIMAMIVHKARGNDQTIDVDSASGRAPQLAHFRNLAVTHGNVAPVGGHTRTIDNSAVLDE